MSCNNNVQIINSGREVCSSDKRRRRTVPYANMIHFIESGQGFFNGMLLHAGQGFVCRRNQCSVYQTLAEDPWTYSWINIVGDYAEQIINMLPLQNDVFTWKPDTQLDILHEIPEASSNLYDKACELRCLGVFYRLASDLIETTVSDKYDYVKQVQIFLKNNYDSNVSISRIAEELHISRAYLRNIFHARTGMSPQEYLMNLRMKRAEFLLSRDYSVTEVAIAIGYDDVLQFSRMFKKYHKLSPTEYRKRYL